MKKLTINEVAERAGVSKTTVSFYLNGRTNKMSEDTQQRIQQVIDETGYEPSAAARSLRTKGSRIIGVILEDVSDPYCARALRGIETTAQSQGYQIVIGNSDLVFRNEETYVKRMMKLGVDGFIVQSTYRFGMLASELEKKNKPVMYLDATPYDYKGKAIKGNNYDCVYQVISECHKKGYQKFLMISDGENSTGTGFENTSGYIDALQDVGIKGSTHYFPLNTKSSQIFELLNQTIHLNEKTLIYVATAALLPTVFQAVKKYPDYHSLFPSTLGLIGFDTSSWTALATPPISAIIPPAYEEGTQVAEELINLLNGKKSGTEILFKNIVKWRETTL